MNLFLSAFIIAISSIARAAPVDTVAIGDGEWSSWGGNTNNNRWAEGNTQISSWNVGAFTQHCKIPYVKGTSAAPVIFNGIAYYPTWNGSFVALNYQFCQVKWQINVTDIITSYHPLTATQQSLLPVVSRSSPQIDGDVLYFTTLANALVVAVDIHTGETLGVTQLSSHPYAVITMSPTFYEGRLFIGLSSSEAGAATAVPNYDCCTFVGAVFALTFDHSSKNFSTAWEVSMLPPGSGQGSNSWSGASVWGSQPSIDKDRNQVFFASGNLYTVPQEIIDCQNQNKTSADGKDPCLPPNVWQESVLAIDIPTGKVNWATQMSALDAWTSACSSQNGEPRNTTLCPNTPGPDADFGMAPTFVSGKSALTPSGIDVVTLGQKNGLLHTLSAANGTVMWSTATSPDGGLGGLTWGVAVDDHQIYFTAVNGNGVTWQLEPSNKTVNNSAFGAASLYDGALVWETEVPFYDTAVAPPTVVGDIVITGRRGTSAAVSGDHGALVILQKGSGRILLEHPLDAAYWGGAAVVGKYILFGSGYSSTANGSFYVIKVGI